jgi:hypothetical protein
METHDVHKTLGPDRWDALKIDFGLETETELESKQASPVSTLE